jgi:RHS repeat-associated protein
VSASTGLPSNGLEPASQSWYTAATNQFTDTSNYDAAGNRKAMSPYTLTYDAENRIVSAMSQNNGSTNYVYDGDGRRVLATFSDGTYTLYVNDANGELAAEYSTIPQTTSGTQYMGADWLGSTRATADANGGNAQRFDYLPFGLELGSLGVANRTAGLGYGGVGPRMKFTGKERDSETGLDYFGFRYFNSPQGRFTSPDEPFAGWDQHDPQSFNLYGYVQNNPLRYTDPDGHDVQVCTNEAGCVWLSDDAYAKARGGNNPGIVAPGGARPNGDITCGGIVCGHATYDGGIQSQTAQIGLTLLGGKSVPLLARAVVDVVSIVVEQDNGVVIGKKTALDQPGTIRPGERELDLPNLNDPKANWAQNSSRLREAMREGKPIRDVSAEPLVNGRPANNTGFLRAERNLLENHGWTYSGGYWNPPVK